MKQRLGLTYSNTTPVSAVISHRFVQLVQMYGGTALLGGIVRIQRKDHMVSKFNSIQGQVDTHVSNLVNTYGLEKTIEVYNMIYSLNSQKKAI
jgi:hypothetical protein